MSDFTGEELIQAAIYDQYDLLNCLLEGECRGYLNKTDRCHRTAVYTSVSNNSYKCLQILLKHGADADIPANEQFNCMTPLHLAILDGKKRIIQLLLDHGADINVKDATGLSPIELARNIEVQEVVFMVETEMARRNKDIDTVGQDFLEACREDDLTAMKTLLMKSNSCAKYLVNQVMEGGITPLHLATEKKNFEMVKWLLDEEADPKMLADNGYAPIHRACEAGCIDIIQHFQQLCPDVVTIQIPDGKSILHICAQSGQVQAIKTILEYQYPSDVLKEFVDDDCRYNLALDINGIDMDGQTALHVACEQGEVGIVEFLVKFKVKPKWKPNKLRTRKSLRKSNPANTSVSKDEVYYPLKVNAVNNARVMPLHIAIKNGFGQIIKKLLEAKADVNSVVKENGKESTALMLACMLGESYIMDILLQYNATDYDRKVFNYAKDNKPTLLSILLKYRTSRDNEFPINKSGMRKAYLEKVFVETDSFDSLSSMNVNYKKTFPSSGVHIKWQDLKHISSIEDEDLKNIGYHHNPSMQTINSRFALYAITKIDVSGNNLGILFPENLLKLPSLHVLDVSRNSISTFGTGFQTECDLLQELRLDNNQITDLPSYIFKFEKLKVLSVAHNFLKEISPEVWVMPSLIVLNLSENKLAVLSPPSTGKTCVKPEQSKRQILLSTPSIDTGSLVSENDIQHSTVWSTQLNVLETEFDLINDSDRQNSGLQDVNLSYNELQDVPPWLACVAPFLENLNLSNNWIKGVGMIKIYPQQLKTLDLSHNRITDNKQFQYFTDDDLTCYSPKISTGSRPPSRGSSGNRTLATYSHHTLNGCQHQMHTILEQLDTLNLSSNEYLKSFTVTKMENSEKLSSSERKLSLSQGPAGLTSSMKSLTEAQEEKTKRLLFPNLTSLDLSYNRHLTQLPVELGDLSILKRLCLSKSAIRELPPQLGRLKHLLTLEIELCPLEGHIQDIISKKNFRTRDILGFLMSVLEESVEYNCMNLMLVGAEKIGKTTLLSEICRTHKSSKKHWNQRKNDRQASSGPNGEFLSTVGIDINELYIGERRSKGAVVFKTWDFGGQKEYYATHQYFLSPRSLYLVMWKLTSGENGVFGIWQWLVNIQARAHGAPVLIIGTHKDELTARATKANFPANFEESMNNLIDSLFVKVDEPEKCGLPNVIGRLNINCKDGSDCKDLVDKIYNLVFELKHPRRKHEKLLNHKVPKKYILLKDIIQDLSDERIKCRKDPVLDKCSYVLKTMEKMNSLSQSVFRDAEDLDQATRFLHENGILFHYEGIGLKDRYFLDPQWLCDQLAQVVTVDQVNNFCRNGVMKTKDLQVLFDKSAFQPEDLLSYICGLLEKFEVALQFDNDKLLIPSLLPTESGMEHVINTNMDAKIYLKEQLIGQRGSWSSVSSNESVKTQQAVESPTSSLILLNTIPTNNVTFACCRLYIMTYFPSGFWPRLITRILADQKFLSVVLNLFPLPAEVLDMCPSLRNNKPFWQPWQTGLQLIHHGTVIFRIKEIHTGKPGLCTYSRHSLKCFLEDQWLPLDMKNSVVLEMCFPSDSITFSFAENMENRPYQTLVFSRKEQIFLEEKSTASFLVKITEHVDNLLQDWYPDIAGSRFEQNCFGRYLITRVIPCPYCLQNIVKKEHGRDTSIQWQLVSRHSIDVLSALDVEDDSEDEEERQEDVLHCFLVERCIMNFQRNHDEICPNHFSVSPLYMLSLEGFARTLYIAPDVVFNDLDRSLVIGQTDTLTLEKKLGRGGFGDVYSGKLRRIEERPKDVAVKILFEFPSVKAEQPRPDQHQLFLEMAVSAYLTARQEVSILRSIRHDHIVPLLGLSARQPLALVLSLAPKGSLRNELDLRKKNNQRLSVFIIKQIVIQVADALKYLHSEKIIYRDLKSDNVLIWDMPSADTIDDIMEPVTVKVADYGISRSVLSTTTGTKGFGGTPPFIAPEILQHGGTNTYTEKVDIFSFGMFLYELITCKQPLEEITNPSLYICQQGRPHITPREKQYPSHFLDLMCICWSHDPESRPTAEQICQIATSHQFCHLADAVSLNSSVGILNGCSVVISDRNGDDEDIDESTTPLSTEIWLSTCPMHYTSKIEVFSYDSGLRCTANRTITYESGHSIEALISVSSSHVWCIDKDGYVTVYHTSSYESVWKFKLGPPHTAIKVLGYRKLPFDVKIVVKREIGKKVADILDVYTICNTIHTIGTKDKFGCLTGNGMEHKELTVNGKCFCAVFHRNTVWLGQCYGKILVIDLDTKAENYLEVSDIGNQTIQCRFLEISNKLDNSVWSYIYPGTVVYKWNAEKMTIDSQFDSHVVASSDAGYVSAHSYEAWNYQITSVKVVDKYLYMGTTWGCLIVADAENLHLGPYTVFRCHSSEDFRIILSLDETEHEGNVPGVITIGTGFRDIVKLASGINTEQTTSDDVFDDDNPTRSAMNNYTHILSWFARNWEYF